MKDRQPTKPNRVLIAPENGSAFYATMTRADEPTEEGTSLNKFNLLKDETAEALGLTSDAVPDDVFNTLCNYSAYSSYIALAGNVNEEMTNAALGKNNESRIKGVGKALAMYAWYKGEIHEFSDLQKCDTLNDIVASGCLDEIFDSPALSALVEANGYASDILMNVLNILGVAVGRSVASAKEVALSESDMRSVFVNYKNAPTFNVDIIGWSKTSANVTKVDDYFYASSTTTKQHAKNRVEKNFGKDLTNFVAVFSDQTTVGDYNDHQPMRFANTTEYGSYYNDDTIANGFTVMAVSANSGQMKMRTSLSTDDVVIGNWGEDILVVCSDGVVSTYSASAGYKTFACDTNGIQQVFIGLAAYTSVAKVHVKCMLVE